MAFFGVPLSGLIASQDQLASVSNNLANLDTVGYKDQTVSFSDLFAQSSLVNASNNPIQTGLGVLPAETSSDFTDGGTSATGVDTNMALTGNGFFVTESASGTISYTRAGDFTTNSSGQLTTANGDLVMGYAPTNGTGAATGVLQPLNVGLGSVTPAIATTTFQLSNNLSATTPIGGTFSSPTTVYDSLGTNHVVTVNYTKTAANTWSYSVTMPSADLSSGSGTATTTSAASFAFGTSAEYTTDTLSGSATIQVGSSGTPVTISAAGDTGAQFLASLQSNATLQAEGVTATLSGSTITLSGPSGLSISNSVADSTAPSALAYTQPTPVTSTVLSTGSLTFDASGNLTSPTSNVAVTIPTFADGAAAMDLTWDLTGSGGSATITQTSLASSANSPTQNGQASGTLSSISVLSDGTIEGIYSNSQSHSLGQVAVATFANEQGLLRTGGNDYEATVGSGLAAVGTANTGGRGTITGGSVEASNVDVAAEFSKMIVAQQAYSANAKAITTFQSISEATIAMISA